MKIFIIINGNTAVTINRININEAVKHAQNYCDHSKEVIVREIDTLRICKTGLYGHELINLK